MAFRGMTVDEKNTFGRRVEEAGTYNVRVLPTSELTTSKNTGNEMLVLHYEVIDGKYAGGQINFDNVTWNDETPEKEEQSLKRFNTLLVAAGFPEGSKVDTLQIMLQGLIRKYNKLNISVDWSDTPSQKGYYNLRVKSRKLLDPEGSKPNGVFAPTNQQANSSFGANNQASANTTDNFGPDPFAGAGQVISDDNLPF
ncbi:DUF669 domain-containing protein [Ligilactobacillus murinus]|uniref:DUF669 domain-containing protein n=1 Tax=Ligilactobacillus murinus TaxID=1622 RepID=UPI001C8B8497|nr:DUF669 domain-containing protein [Ligilactobacillus murinus]MBX9013330.1 DUF669 domain-containing protein [Ligilactobacillus murinus]